MTQDEKGDDILDALEGVRPGMQSKVVAVEAIVQSSADDGDTWAQQGSPFPALFIDEAKKYRDFRRQAYPHLKTRLVRRYTTVSDEVVED